MAPPLIALAGPGDPTDPTAYSGAQAALLAGFAAIGVDVLPLRGALPAALDAPAVRVGALARLRPGDLRDVRGAVAREWEQARLGRPMQALRRAHLARQVRGLPDGVAGVVQCGTEYELPTALPVVTYEDSTLTQALRSWDWGHLRAARPGDLARYERRARATYDGARACTAMSGWAARSIRDDFGQPAAKVHVTGIGQNHRAAAAADRDWSVPRFLFVGVHWERKGGPEVVEAFAAVRSAWPEATLDVVGGHPPLSAPGVTGHGRLFLDRPADRERMAAFFARATCFVMPSRHEPTGTVHAEAAGAGVPSIGTTDGGVRTVVGDAGRLVDPGDAGALRAAMLELADPAVAADLGARARARSELFTWEAVAGRLLRALAPPGVDLDGLADFLPLDA